MTPPRRHDEDHKAARPPPSAASTTKARPAATEREVDERVRAELPRAEIIARKIAKDLRLGVLLDDLVSYGHDGLLQAARSFDPSLGVPFRRWASYRVRGAILDGVRRGAPVPRATYTRLRMIEAAAHVAEQADEDDSGAPVLSAVDADGRLAAHLAGMATAVAAGLIATPTTPNDQPPPDEALANAETAALVRATLEQLPDKERHLLQRHYFEDVPFETAAEELGLSKSWGSRLHARAIEAIWRNLKRRGVTTDAR